MTVLESFEKASKDAGIRTVLFCDMYTEQEFSNLVKSMKPEQCPINILDSRSLQSNGTWETGRRKAIIPLEGWVVTRIKENTKTTRSRELETTYIEPMKKLTKLFLKNVLKMEVYDASREMTDTIRGAYQVSNEHFFGTKYTASVPVVDGYC